MAATITSAPRFLQTIQNGHYRLQKALPRNFNVIERFASSMTVTSDSDSDNPLPADRRIDFDAESLAARGYLRNQKAYTPPSDVESKILQVCERYLGKQNTFPDATTKYNILVQCCQSLQHSVPNSLIHKITSIDELMAFYKTPISTTVPLDMMKDMDLPKNLHVIYKYNRFHPETDTKFGGISAYTKDSTLVTGIKYKKKYPGYNASPTWPFEQ